MFAIDFQGFQYKTSDFYIREIAIKNLTSECMVRKFIRLPQISGFDGAFKKQVLWNMRHLHGLSWDGGLADDDNYDEDWDNQLRLEDLDAYIKNIIPGDAVVIVKGLNKKTVLSKFIVNNIIDVDELNCPKLKILKRKNWNTTYHCNYHIYNDLSCAQENVILIGAWYIKKNVL